MTHPVKQMCPLVAILVSCQHAPSPASSVAIEEPRGHRFEMAFEEAERLRDSALSDEPPRFVGGVAPAVLAHQERLIEWWKNRRAAMERVDAEYERALELSSSADDRTHLFVSWTEYRIEELNEYGAAILETAPSSDRSREKLLEFEGWFGISWSSVLSLLERCDTEARSTEKPESNHPCDAVRDRIRTYQRAEDRRDAKRDEPCEFSGPLQTHAEAFALMTDRVALGKLTAGWPAEVAKFNPPAKLGYRPKIQLRWPIEAPVYFERGSKLIALRNTLPVIDTHIWLTPDTEVEIARAHDASALVRRPVNERFWGVRPALEPSEVTQEVVCVDLELATRVWHEEPLPRGDSIKFKQAGVVLYDTPNGSPISTLGEVESHHGFDGVVVERRDGWVRVRGRSPFAFDAWAPAGEVEEGEEFGMIGILNRGDNQSFDYVAEKRIPLFLEPDAKKESGWLALGAPVQFAAGVGMVQVRIIGFSDKRPLYAKAAELRDGLRWTRAIPFWER